MSTNDYSWKELWEVWLNQCYEKDEFRSMIDTGKRCEERLYDFHLIIVGYEWLDFHKLFYKNEVEEFIDYIKKMKEKGNLKQFNIEQEKEWIRVTVNNM